MRCSIGCLASRLLFTATLVAATVPAHAQDAPVWRFRIGSGVLVAQEQHATLAPGRQLEIGRVSPVITFDAVRALDASLELVVGGVAPFTSAIVLDKNAGPASGSRLAPSGIHVGMNYCWNREATWRWSAGGLLAAFTRDRTVLEDGNSVMVSPAYGWGLTAGVSRVLKRRALPGDAAPPRARPAANEHTIRDEWVVFEAGVRWHHMNVFAGDGRMAWNPLVITAGVGVHLW